MNNLLSVDELPIILKIMMVHDSLSSVRILLLKMVKSKIKNKCTVSVLNI